MQKLFLRYLTGAALTVFLVVAGCTEQRSPMLPDIEASGASHSDGTDATGTKWYIIKGKPTDATKYAEVIIYPNSANRNERSGSVGVAGNVLFIPEGAVSKDTKFTVTLASGSLDGTSKVQVKLQALERDSKGEWKVSVGHLGFLKPLPLRLTYEWAEGTFDPAKLRVIWLKSTDGSVQAFPTKLDSSGRTITTELSHFSDYAAATP